MRRLRIAAIGVGAQAGSHARLSLPVMKGRLL